MVVESCKNKIFLKYKGIQKGDIFDAHIANIVFTSIREWVIDDTGLNVS